MELATFDAAATAMGYNFLSAEVRKLLTPLHVGMNRYLSLTRLTEPSGP